MECNEVPKSNGYSKPDNLSSQALAIKIITTEIDQNPKWYPLPYPFRAPNSIQIMQLLLKKKNQTESNQRFNSYQSS